MSTKTRKLLLVDDDNLIHESIRLTLPSHWSLTSIKGPTEAPREKFDAAFVDMHLMPGSSEALGLQVIEKLSRAHPHLEIVATSGDLDRDLMEACLKAGASRFLAKPLSPQEIEMVLRKIEALHLLQEASLRTQDSNLAWIGQCQASQEIRRRIAALQAESGPILIEGESGCGKEVVSRLINAQEGRPFLSVNVAAISDTLFESEFFGHVKGAFTGADQNKMGIAEAANNGDLFLDEIEALPLQNQAKLLRFLESGEVRRVGGRETIIVETRIIAATNQPLAKMVKEGKFREDLMWRLNGKKIDLPPLRERVADIKDLADHFLSMGRPKLGKKLSQDALAAMSAYGWPGNVRELKRVIEQALLISPLPIIRSADVLPLMRTSSATSATIENVDLTKGLGKLVEEFEKTIIERALKIRPEVDSAAELLSVSRSSLYKKIKDLGVITD